MDIELLTACSEGNIEYISSYRILDINYRILYSKKD